MSRDRIPLSSGPLILGGAAVLLTLVMLVGLLLPTSWDASASRVVAASPETIFGYLGSSDGWRAWTPWPDSGVVAEGPTEGVGATLVWDDADLGSGRWQLVEVTPPRRVEYSVEVEGGALTTHGSVSLLPSTSDEGVLVTWRESGDLGRNPLMGYWGLFMRRAQRAELEKGLDRLAVLAEAGALKPSGAPTR